MGEEINEPTQEVTKEPMEETPVPVAPGPVVESETTN